MKALDVLVEEYVWIEALDVVVDERVCVNVVVVRKEK